MTAFIKSKISFTAKNKISAEMHLFLTEQQHRINTIKHKCNFENSVIVYSP